MSRDRGTTVGYLPQEVGGAAAGSVLSEALAGFDEVWALERELEEVAAALAADPSEALTARYGELQHRFESRGGYRLEAEAGIILGGLGFRLEDFHRPLTELSGGWRMRAALARLLLRRPSLLLLDEPTEGIQPSVILEIEDAIQRIKRELGLTVLLVEQYLDFAERLADNYVIMAKGAVVAAGATHELKAEMVRRHLAV